MGRGCAIVGVTVSDVPKLGLAQRNGSFGRLESELFLDGSVDHAGEILQHDGVGCRRFLDPRG
jgi:hypothetical protein